MVSVPPMTGLPAAEAAAAIVGAGAAAVVGWGAAAAVVACAAGAVVGFAAAGGCVAGALVGPAPADGPHAAANSPNPNSKGTTALSFTSGSFQLIRNRGSSA